MTFLNIEPNDALKFYLTRPHPCSYLPGREASTLFADPEALVSGRDYGALLARGFRRSGKLFYRPHCALCDACIPLRVPVAEFKPRRSQRRVLRLNRDVAVQRSGAVFNDEHFRLYKRYMTARHCAAGDAIGSQDYQDFLLHPPEIDCALYEMRVERRLLAVALVDRVPQGLSAVYTFYDPAETHRSLGVYAVLWQIREAQRLGLPWVYLGYWIKQCARMSYKDQYRPCEIYRQGRWRRLEPGTDVL
ncbi:MAG: arginyltransferase [Gammaproteobacteria bacterium]|nr:MAG: arginyltransferase [Gammaproteobacteria bacterium]